MGSTDVSPPSDSIETMFHHLIISNNPPSDEELAQIQSLYQEPDAQIKNIEAKIASLEKEIAALKEEKETLVNRSKVHKLLLSPLRHFSSELLQTIFLFCLTPGRNAVMYHSEAPLVLGRICRRWRQVAYETPDLWNSVHVVVPECHESVNGKWKKLYEGMQDWLKRSGDLPLNLSIDAETTLQDKIEESYINLTLFLETLKGYSKRWKTLHLIMPADRPVTLCTLGPEDVPILEKFSIHHSNTPGSWSPTQPVLNLPSFIFLRNAPLLRSLLTVNYPSGMGFPEAPLSQLTELRLHFPMIDLLAYLPSILNSCTNLKILGIRYMVSLNSSTFVPGVHPAVTMDHLEKLLVVVSARQLLSNQTSDINCILSLIFAPKLTHIDLGCGFDVDPFPALEDLIRRSGCSLKDVYLRSTVAAVEDLIGFLLICREVEKLTFSCREDMKDIEDASTDDEASNAEEDDPSKDEDDENKREPLDTLLSKMILSTPETSIDSVICPQLQFLHVKNGFRYYTKTLKQFIDSRSDPVPESGLAKLKSIKLGPLYTVWGEKYETEEERDKEKEWHEDAMRWRNAGMKVKIDLNRGTIISPHTVTPWRGVGGDADSDAGSDAF